MHTLLQHIELLRYRALAELRRDSSGMYLGMIWWVLEPILYMLVFYIIFGIGLKKGGIDFVFYLLFNSITDIFVSIHLYHQLSLSYMFFFLL